MADTINIFDSSAGTDVILKIQRGIMKNVTLNDASTVTDSITNVIIKQLVINISDTSAITESLSIIIPTLNYSVFENCTVTESVVIFLVNVNINTTESINVSEWVYTCMISIPIWKTIIGTF